MRWLLCLILVSCGGGGGSVPETGTIVLNVRTTPAPAVSPPPAPVDWRDYTPLRGPSYAASGWRSVQVAADTVQIYWGPDYWETQRVAPNPADAGRPWLFLDAYDSPLVHQLSVTTRAEIDRFDGRGWVDINPLLQTSPYLPVEIGPQGVRVRMWGWMVINGQPVNRWFWASTVTPQPLPLYNPCWLLNESSRATILQQEAWWDQQQAWTDRGAGDIDPQTREPSGEGIVYRYYLHNARMIRAGDGQLHGGYAWQYGYNGQPTGCAQF